MQIVICLVVAANMPFCFAENSASEDDDDNLNGKLLFIDMLLEELICDWESLGTRHTNLMLKFRFYHLACWVNSSGQHCEICFFYFSP